MPAKKKGLAAVLLGLRAVGLSRSLQAALYPFRRAYYEGKFRQGDKRGSVLRGLAGLRTALQAPPPERPLDTRDLTTPGEVMGHDRQGQTVTVRCVHASLQLTFLAADLVRVRLSPAGEFPARRSYAVAKTDPEWTPVPFTLNETGQAIEIHTERLTCRIDKKPCRLSFWDRDGQRIHADSAGLGWRGKRKAHLARLEPGEHVYGLGEKAFPLNRRGHSYTLWNIDSRNYAPGHEPLYLSIPFYVGQHGSLGYGMFYDNTYRAGLDLQSSPDEAIYWTEDGELCYYFFYGPTLAAVLERYTELTGRLPLPPLWALGYQQSRWSYYPESRVREIARLFREHQVPCDVLYLDIDYMDGFRCFTWDKERFPDPAGLIADLHGQGMKLVVIIDCGIKADRHYAVCAQGLAQGLFCAYPDGQVAGGPVWPGESYFPDFTNPRAREWWGQLHAPLLEAGVDGLWNDMNEPTVSGSKADTLVGNVRHDMEGAGGDHEQAHNVYGMLMVRATAEGLQRLRPDQRPFVLTRSGWAGVQRYAIAWTGDNQSTWEHLQLTLPMVMGLGLSGLGFTGADVGGFDGGASAELLVRWTQLGAFLPFFRNHSARWSNNQEPWAYGEPYLSLNRAAIELRYRLLPYLYTATWQHAQKGQPIVRPLVWSYTDDTQTHSLDDQFLCGDALLVAPVCAPGATSREVYLPAGDWFDFWTDGVHHGPLRLQAPAPLESIPVYVRAGTVLPTWPVQQYVGEKPAHKLILHVYPGDGDSWLYEDDGESLAYQRGDWRSTRFECRQTPQGGLRVTCQSQGVDQPGNKQWEWHVHGLASAPHQLLADGQPLPNGSLDASRHLLSFDTGPVQSIELS